MQDKVIGIIGGMGSKSTAYFFLRIICATPARKDQDHLRIIIDNNPQIPARSSAILREGESPLPELEKTLHNLERAGAQLIAMPCNTAHYYYHELQKSTDIPIINMVSETAEYIRRNLPNINRIGLLATTGTLRAGIYHDALKGTDMEIIVPDEVTQKRIMKAIYGTRGIKAGYTQDKSQKELVKVAQVLIARGAEAIILGCTEISSVLNQRALHVPLVDSMQILAEVVVEKARVVNCIQGEYAK